MNRDTLSTGGIPDFNRLVEGLLENNLSEAEMKRLETILNDSPEALQECARRMKFEAELSEVCDPVYLELRQNRRMVIHGRGESQRVSMQEIQTAHFGNSRGTAILPFDRPPGRQSRAARWVALYLPLLLVLLAGAYWLLKPDDALPNGPAEGTTVSSPVWTRRPGTDDEMRFWLENMVVRHHYSLPEVTAATGMEHLEILEALERLGIRYRGTSAESGDASLSIMPYPGGRHPRLRELQFAINPQRDTKVSIFTPWAPHEYVVVDLPEYLRTDNEFIYLAHTDIPTRWTKMNVHLRPQEWSRAGNGDLSSSRKMPDGSSFGASVKLKDGAVRMELWFENGTLAPVVGLWAQVCVMPARVRGFSELSAGRQLRRNEYTACRNPEGNRWIITAWHRSHGPGGNPTYPCFHSDSTLGDCAPGETVRARGWLSFYEGTDVDAELNRIDATGWREGD